MSDFLDFNEGFNKVWVTGIKFIRGTNDKPRNNIELTFAVEPTSVSHTAKFTNVKVGLPLSSDSTPAKIAMERRIKAVFYPLAGFEANKKCTIKELYAAMAANLANHDLSVDIEVKLVQGRQPDKFGNDRFFPEILTLAATGFADKKAYESEFDCDDVDVFASEDGTTPF